MAKRKRKKPTTGSQTPKKKRIKLTLKPDPTITGYDPGFEAALTDWISKRKST